jgi:RNA polymerase sigma-70 factor (ECF subfamily)
MARASGHVEADTHPRAPAVELLDTEQAWAALAQGARRGAPEGARRLFEAITPVVRRVCRGVLGHRHLDLEDTVQESLVDVLRALPHYRSEGHLVHYVTKIAIRRAILTRKREARRLRSLRVLEHLHGSDALEGSHGSAAEQSLMVSEVIARVSDVQGETLVLRVILGFSVEEVASIMSASVNTVRTRLFLAKNALRRMVALRREP